MLLALEGCAKNMKTPLTIKRTAVTKCVLSIFIINFAASVQQYAQVAAIFFGVYLIVEGLITQGALIGAVILGGRTMGHCRSWQIRYPRERRFNSYRNLAKLIGERR